MPKSSMGQKVGDAPIKQQGHTSNGNFGSNLRDKARYHGSPEALKLK